MNTKAILLTILFVALSVGAYIAYEYFSRNDSPQLMALVPGSAVALYQRGECEACIDSVGQTSAVTLVANVSLLGDTTFQKTKKQLLKVAVLIAVHQVTKNQFDFTYYATKNDFSFLESMPSQERLFEGLRIKQHRVGTQVLAWTDIDDYRIVSHSPILVEDVIRTYKSKVPNNQFSAAAKLRKHATVKNDAGDLLVRTQASGLLNPFAEDELPATNVSGFTILDIKKENKSLILNGFTEPDTLVKFNVFTLFQDQSPVAFRLKSAISNDAQYVLHYGFSNASIWGKRLQAMYAKPGVLLDNAQIKRLQEGLANELAMVSLEVGAGQSTTVVLATLSGTNTWLEILTTLQGQPSDSSTFEQYSDFSIGVVKGNIPGEVFPLLELDYTDTYYAQVGDVLVMAEDIRALKKTIDDFEQENVWSKSVEMNKLLGSALLESNITFFANTSKASPLLKNTLAPVWKDFFKKISLPQHLGVCIIQFSRLTNTFYTQVLLNQPTHTYTKPLPKEVLVNLTEGVAAGVFLVKNHVDKSWEIVIQDSSRNLCLFSKQGQLLWKRPLDGWIKGKVHQVDYFANGKLQLLLTTEKTLYLIDRLGNPVAGFPKTLPLAVELLSLIDYDHSRKYRYLFADKKGVMKMTDKDVQLLDGWNALAAGGELFVAPRHYRIAGKDYITALRKDGHFRLYTRRGELLKDVELKTRVREDYFFVTGSKSEKPHFVFVSTDGFRIKIALTGEELSREQLIKSASEVTFSLITEKHQRQYMVSRQDSRSTSLLTPALKEVITNRYVGLNHIKVQAYDFGAGFVYYVLIDETQDLAYLYNAEGNMLTEQPLECQQISLAYENSRVVAITAFNKRLSFIYL